MTPRFTALYDATVLYPSLLRNLPSNRPDLGHDRVKRVRALMGETIPDARVIGYASSLQPSTSRIQMTVMSWLQ